MNRLLASAAALALLATPSLAEPGKGKGHEKHNDHPAAAKIDRGPSGKAAEKAARKAHDDMRKLAKEQAKEARDLRKQAKDARIDRAAHKAAKREKYRDDRPTAIATRYYGPGHPGTDFRAARHGGLIDGCPPGLAKKRNGCIPPGLAKSRDDWRADYVRPGWWGIGGDDGGRYYFDDGYLYRLTDNRISGFLPLLGGALAMGNPWPSYYGSSQLPDYYVDYFNLGDRDAYRFADDVIYRVDPKTTAITSVVALLTGDDFVVGQPIPPGYDVYNVPYAYRDRYRDTPDALYRYSDGYIYRVDPETRLVSAVIEMLL